MESTARNYFEKFTGPDAAEVLQGLPCTNPKTFENEWLDFKSGKANGSIEEIWSRALGGFANNEGGVLVWGIDARKDKDTGVDAAQSVVPVPDIEKLTTMLKDTYRFATDPPLAGVEIVPIPLNADTKEGFVICYIPEGKTKPYRSEKAGKRFLLRFGDEQKEPSVSILRQLFYPKYQPHVEIKLYLIEKPEHFLSDNVDYMILSASKRTVVRLFIANGGEVSISDMAVIYQAPNCRIIQQCKKPYIEQNRNELEVSKSILHPKMAIDTDFVILTPPTVTMFQFEVWVFARDSHPFYKKYLFMGDGEPMELQK